MIGDPSFHRWRNPERLVDSAKVVEREPQRNGGPVVLPFFTEGVGEPGEPARTHADTEVLAFDNRSANTLRIGAAQDWDNLCGGHLSGAVAGFAILGRCVHLDEHRVVAAVMQRGGDRGAIGRKPISGYLEVTVPCGVAHSFHEMPDYQAARVFPFYEKIRMLDYTILR